MHEAKDLMVLGHELSHTAIFLLQRKVLLLSRLTNQLTTALATLTTQRQKQMCTLDRKREGGEEGGKRKKKY